MCVGNFVLLLAKKFATTKLSSKFKYYQLFPKLIIRHYIESKSIQLFYIGLVIVKNLLKKCGSATLEFILEYEDACADSLTKEAHIRKKGFLEYVYLAL